ncbi:hypothetical protein KKH43_00170 [Patescibacteria group bacterium]|nr:hypothetical protein [Patescibacteria group bacterium]
MKKKVKMFIFTLDSVEAELINRAAGKLSISVGGVFNLTDIHSKYEVLAHKCFETLLSDPDAFWIITMEMGWTSNGLLATLQAHKNQYDCVRLMYYLSGMLSAEMRSRVHIILMDADVEGIDDAFLPDLKRTQIDEKGIEPVLGQLITDFLENSS